MVVMDWFDGKDTLTFFFPFLLIEGENDNNNIEIFLYVN